MRIRDSGAGATPGTAVCTTCNRPSGGWPREKGAVMTRRKLGWLTGFEPATARSTIWSSNQAELQPPTAPKLGRRPLLRQPDFPGATGAPEAGWGLARQKPNARSGRSFPQSGASHVPATGARGRGRRELAGPEAPRLPGGMLAATARAGKGERPACDRRFEADAPGKRLFHFWSCASLGLAA